MTPEELAIERDETRLSLGLIPMADLRQMKADHKRSEERDKQWANAKGSAASDPLEIDNDDDENENDSDNDKGRTKFSLTTTATPSLTKVGI